MWNKKISMICATVVAILLAFAMTTTVYADDIDERPDPTSTTTGEPDGTTCLITLSLSPDWARPSEEVQLNVMVGDSNRNPYSNEPLNITIDGETFLDDIEHTTDSEGRYQAFFNALEEYGIYEITVGIELDSGSYIKSINLTVDPNPEENQPIGERDNGNNHVVSGFDLSKTIIFVGVGIICIGIVSGLYIINRKRK